MHRKDDQYSPILFLDAENDVPACEIVSAQKSVAPGASRKRDRLQAGAINPARKWPVRAAASAGSDNKFYKSPHV
jgi:hypothetical protein